MTPVKWTARSMQRAVALQLDMFRYTMVPNINLGSGDEMDLAVLTPSGLLWEVEIKTTLHDWKRDLEKLKWKLPPDLPYRPARFYYAVPHSLIAGKDGTHSVPGFVLDFAGVVSFQNVRATKTLSTGQRVHVDQPVATIIRTAKPMHRNKLPQKYIDEMYRKLSIRYWKRTWKIDQDEPITINEEPA